MLECTFEQSMNYSFFELPVTALPIQDVKCGGGFRNTLSEIADSIRQHGFILRKTPTFQEGFFDKEGVRAHRKRISLLLDYVFNYQQAESINMFLEKNPSALALICKLPTIVGKIYGGKTKKEIKLVIDPDTGSTLVEVCILTTLPIDNEFWVKDRQLYSEIQQTGVAEGLEYVVLAQG